MSRHGPEKRQALRAAYVHRRLPLPAAAAECGVPFDTARKWKDKARRDGDDWDKARAAGAMAGEAAVVLVRALIEDFINLHQSVLDAVKGDGEMPALAKVQALSMLADAFSKTMAAAGKAAPELSALAVAQEVLRMLGDFIRNNYPKHGPAFVEVLEPFGAEVAKRYG
ncbi:MAG: DUF1804 family protein [Magnetospirillum sp. WYHS-4]